MARGALIVTGIRDNQNALLPCLFIGISPDVALGCKGEVVLLVPKAVYFPVIKKLL